MSRAIARFFSNLRPPTPTSNGAVGALTKTAATTEPIEEPRAIMDDSAPNIIVFGETGSGKSSVINMLEGDKEAEVGNKAKGVTFSSNRYAKVIQGQNFNVYDTVGLNEGSSGTASPETAIRELYTLMHSLERGINLLVFVMRAPRLKDTAQRNYNMFYSIFCQSAVKVVMVVTGLEDEDNRDQWFQQNQSKFDEAGMMFSDVACITASKGKRKKGKYTYEEEYNYSKDSVAKLIFEQSQPDSWCIPVTTWFTTVIAAFCRLLVVDFNLKSVRAKTALYDALRLYANLSEEEAKKRADETENVIWEAKRKKKHQGPEKKAHEHARLGSDSDNAVARALTPESTDGTGSE